MMHLVLLVHLIVLPTHLWATVTEEPTSFPAASNGEPFPWNKMRLPDTITPLLYNLLIHPNLTSLDFTGYVQIQIQVHQDTKSIILHSKDLRISKARLLNTDRGQVQPLKVLEYPLYQQIALMSHDLLKSGSVYVIQLMFAANLSESFHGFYKSTYRTSKGETRYTTPSLYKSMSILSILYTPI